MEWLYEHTMDIGDEKLRSILSLPLETLVINLYVALEKYRNATNITLVKSE